MPCQPFSTAGKRKGTKDERHLWPYVRDAIRALRPRLVVLENVRGHLTLGFDVVLADLAALGMSARWGVVRASDAGAPHGRARLFIVAWWPADSDGPGLEGLRPAIAAGWPEPAVIRDDASDAEDIGRERIGSARRRRAGSSDDDLTPGDAIGHGHGLVLLPGGVGGVAPGAATEPRERQRSRGVTDPAGGRDAPDAEGGGRGTRPGRRTAATGHEVSRTGDGYRGAVEWGKYEPAIHRWERVLGRPAPVPAVPRATGRDRLSPAFVEWMMGLPEGHVTGHGLSHGAELTLLGNGVVPQQAALALRMLLPHALTHAA